MRSATSWSHRSLLLFLIVGLIVGFLLSLGFPTPNEIPFALTLPFWLLLGSIATGPVLVPHFWEKHFGSVAMLFAGTAAALMYTILPQREALDKIAHAALEYFSFIALVGGLYVVSGSIVVTIRGRGSSFGLTAFLAAGAVLANVLGTTGASVLLIRAFLKLIGVRRKALHVIYFIFIISNCGGLLTPIGDPPLYLGYLAGVPFFWTTKELFIDWIFVTGILLCSFFLIDWLLLSRNSQSNKPQKDLDSAWLAGKLGIFSLFIIVATVFADPLLKSLGINFPVPITPIIQIATAYICYVKSPRALYEKNEFSFLPLQEVALLFFAIFITMQPALGYLALHGWQLGLSSPHAFAVGTGILSAVLDNAPTYVSMLQVAYAGSGLGELSPNGVQAFALSADGGLLLRGIATGAVFFGGMTYIGNGPNFMVRSIAENAGVKMPSFFGYFAWACVLLLPILLLHVWVCL